MGLRGAYRESPWARRVTGVLDAPEGSYRQLEAVATALGLAPRGGPHLEVLVDGLSVRIELRWGSGPAGVVLVVTRDGRVDDEPVMTLRPEGEDDVEAKAQGIVREVQTGDPAFDGRFYIGGTTSPVETAKLLAVPAYRQCVTHLFDLGRTPSNPEGSPLGELRITPRRLSIEVPIWAHDVYPPELVLALLDDLLWLARAGAPGGRAVAPRGGCALGLLVLALLGGFGLTILQLGDWRVAWTVVLLTGVLGALVGVALGVPWRRYVAGHPESRSPALNGSIVLVLVGAFAAPGVLVWGVKGAAGDRTTAERGVCSGPDLSVDTEGTECDYYFVRWSDGSVGSYCLSSPEPGTVFERDKIEGPLSVTLERRPIREVPGTRPALPR